MLHFIDFARAFLRTLHAMACKLVQANHGRSAGRWPQASMRRCRICQEERLQRTVAVEVKVIRTNAGRRRLIDVMRWAVLGSSCSTGYLRLSESLDGCAAYSGRYMVDT